LTIIKWKQKALNRGEDYNDLTKMGFFDNFSKSGTAKAPSAAGSPGPITSLPPPKMPPKQQQSPISAFPQQNQQPIRQISPASLSMPPQNIPTNKPAQINEVKLPPPPRPIKHARTKSHVPAIEEAPVLLDNIPKTDMLQQTDLIKLGMPQPNEVLKTSINIEPQQDVALDYQTEAVTPMLNDSVPDELPELSVPSPSRPLPLFNNVNIDRDFELEEIPIFDTAKEIKVTNIKRGPLYIRTDEFSQILNNIDTMKNYVLESPDTIYILNNLKKNLDNEHKNYAKVLEDIQRILIYVDNMLFESMK